METDLVIVDDSGLLGLVDAPTYTTFVGEAWTYEQLMGHFADQMRRGAILVWDCADGGNNYRVRVRDRFTTQSGYREAAGQILVSGDSLHLASYTALTMAAQFPECRIPGNHEEGLTIPVEPGPYRVRVVQMYAPESVEGPAEGVHFLLELEAGEALRWEDVVWRSA